MSTTLVPTVWKIDQSHSQVDFAVKHMMFSTVRGSFRTFEGQIETTGDPRLGKVSVTIDGNSVDTGDDKRNEHLRSQDFFESAGHPNITFESTKVEPGRGDHFKVYGDLTIRGVTNPVVLDAEYHGSSTNPWGQTVAGYSASTTINREDWGVNWNAALEGGGVLVSKDVKLSLEGEVVQQD